MQISVFWCDGESFFHSRIYGWISKPGLISFFPAPKKWLQEWQKEAANWSSWTEFPFWFFNFSRAKKKGVALFRILENFAFEKDLFVFFFLWCGEERRERLVCAFPGRGWPACFLFYLFHINSTCCVLCVSSGLVITIVTEVTWGIRYVVVRYCCVLARLHKWRRVG
jgi:hypothetical protein